MTHIITRPRPETLTVDFNGKRFEIRLDENGAQRACHDKMTAQ